MTANTEKALMPNKHTANEPVASFMKPIAGADKTPPRELKIDMTPNPTPALLGPNISAGIIFTTGVVMAMAIPMHRTENVSVKFEPKAKVRNAKVINSGPRIKKCRLFPILSDR